MPQKTRQNEQNNSNFIILLFQLLQAFVNYLISAPRQLRNYYYNPQEGGRSIEELANWIDSEQNEAADISRITGNKSTSAKIKTKSNQQIEIPHAESLAVRQFDSSTVRQFDRKNFSHCYK